MSFLSDARAEILTHEIAAINAARSPGDVLVLAHGCFDILHIGHIRHLQAAKKLGTKLVVLATADEHVGKGPHQPVNPVDIRVECLRAIRFVDYALANAWWSGAGVIERLKPDIFAKGPEAQTNPTEGMLEELEAIARVGGKMAYVGEVLGSSTGLLKKVIDHYG